MAGECEMKCSNTRCNNEVKKVGQFCKKCKDKKLHLTSDERIKQQLDELERKNGRRK